MTNPVYHIAGEPAQMVQKCSACGEVMTDYSNAMFLENDNTPAWWEVGKPVTHDGPCWAVGIHDGALPCTQKVQ